MQYFSQRLKWLREKSGKTQKEVAESIGVSQQYYGRFEKGTAEPNLETLVKIADLFEEELEFLCGRTHLDFEADKLFYSYFEKRYEVEKNDYRLQNAINYLANNKLPIHESEQNELVNRLSVLQSGKVREMNEVLSEFNKYVRTIPLVHEAYLRQEYLDYSFNDFKERYFLNAYRKDET